MPRTALALTAALAALAFPAAAAADDMLCSGDSAAVECAAPAPHGDTSSEPAALIAPQAEAASDERNLTVSVGKRNGKRIAVTVANHGSEAVTGVRVCVKNAKPRCATFARILAGGKVAKTFRATGGRVTATIVGEGYTVSS